MHSSNIIFKDNNRNWVLVSYGLFLDFISLSDSALQSTVYGRYKLNIVKVELLYQKGKDLVNTCLTLFFCRVRSKVHSLSQWLGRSQRDQRRYWQSH